MLIELCACPLVLSSVKRAKESGPPRTAAFWSTAFSVAFNAGSVPKLYIDQFEGSRALGREVFKIDVHFSRGRVEVAASEQWEGYLA